MHREWGGSLPGSRGHVGLWNAAEPRSGAQ